MPSRFRFSPLSLVLAASLILGIAIVARTQSPSNSGEQFDLPSFSAQPEALFKAAESVSASKDDHAIVLLRELEYTFDEKNRLTTRRRLIYRVLHPEAVDGWSKISSQWSPWHQAKPEMRARVITPDFVAHPLDPATLGESPVASSQENVFTDSRSLAGPLPAVTTGAVIEEEFITRDTAPFFEAGQAVAFRLEWNVPIHRTRILIHAPASLPLRHLLHNLPPESQRRTESDGRVRIEISLGPLEKSGDYPPFAAPESRSGRQVAFSTGASWQDVSRRYSLVVEEQLRNADLKARVSRITAGRKSTLDIATAALADLQKSVRYTGVEFGEASIIPRTPQETLTRKYGDCKDKSALLVAMLRAAGVPATLALLNTGPGEDIDPELPGFGLFDHAIVYVPGPPALWIDPTDEFSRVNELPLADQDRLALIVSPETTALVKTPASTSAQNRTVERREFILAEFGPARVTETVDAAGSIESSYRHSLGAPGEPAVRKQLEEYVKSNYIAESLTRMERTPAEDLTQPFRITMVADRAARGSTSLIDAAVGIPFGGLFNRLPQVLRTDPKEDAEEGEDPPKPRTVDFVLYEPFRAEWQYRIVPPDGFRPRELPPSTPRNFGPIRLTQEFSADPQGIVTATIPLETPTRRFTPAEVEETRTAILSMFKENMTMVHFDQVGEALLSTGKVREALEEFRALAARQPRSALPLTRAARALLAAGIGDAARAKARRATELDPASARAWQTLAWVLQHDSVGRRLAKGFDHEGSLAAYRKALELDPKDNETRANFAILLTHSPTGESYGPGWKAVESIAEYQALGDALFKLGIGNNLPVTLWYAGRYDEMSQYLEKNRQVPGYHAYTIALTARKQGAPAALRKAQEGLPNEATRRSILASSGMMLLNTRDYSQAADLIAASARGSDNAAQLLAQADLFRQFRRHEEVKLSETDPADLVRSFWIAGFTSADPGERIFSLFTKETLAEMSEDSRKELKGLGEAVRRLYAQSGLTGPVVADLALAAFTLTSESKDGVGHRVTCQIPGVEATFAFYVVQESGNLRLLSVEEVKPLGRQALRLANSGNLDAARQWLDWARDESSLRGGEDPLSGTAFPRLWTKGEAATPDAVRYAAASLMVGGRASAAAVPVLLEAREKAATDALRNTFDLALLDAYVELKQYENLAVVSRRLVAAEPASLRAFSALFLSLVRLQRWDELDAAIQQRLARLPDDRDALRMRADAALRKGDFPRAIEFGKALIATGKPESGDINNLAWTYLLLDNVTQDAIQLAQRSTMMSKNQDFSSLHTLAALYAEVGKTTEAREIILQAMTVADQAEPEGNTWFIFGRIAEHFGEREAALTAYSKVKKPEDEIGSSYWLTQRRIKAMGSAPAK